MYYYTYITIVCSRYFIFLGFSLYLWVSNLPVPVLFSTSSALISFRMIDVTSFLNKLYLLKYHLSRLKFLSTILKLVLHKCLIKI